MASLPAVYPEGAAGESKGRRALVRPPSEAYVRCIREDASRRIDLAEARRQHAEYRRALEACGLEVIQLPEEPGFPDSCFVEDTAVIAKGRALITRPGAASRRGETASVESALAKLLPCRRLSGGTLDGGDVLVTERGAFVGISARTDSAGAVSLEEIGISVQQVPVGSLLHLKTGVTPLGGGVLIQRRGAFPAGAFADFDILETDEPQGANVLAIGAHVIVSTEAPETAAMLRRRGMNVHAVDLREFHAGDAGATCLSVLF